MSMLANLKTLKSICVFSGSNIGNKSEFTLVARKLGSFLAKNNIRMVYGGAEIGLMGAAASAALGNGGFVIGVIPRFLQEKEIAHPGLTELIVCETMHERKMKMFELSQGFIALPGGFGTLEEVIEILTWLQLGLHSCPVGFLNVNGYYNHLKAFFDEMENSQLLKPEHKKMAIFAENVEELFEKFQSYQSPEIQKWIPGTSGT